MIQTRTTLKGWERNYFRALGYALKGFAALGFLWTTVSSAVILLDLVGAAAFGSSWGMLVLMIVLMGLSGLLFGKADALLDRLSSEKAATRDDVLHAAQPVEGEGAYQRKPLGDKR